MPYAKRRRVGRGGKVPRQTFFRQHLQFTLTKIRDPFARLTGIRATIRRMPDVWRTAGSQTCARARCALSNGKGRPENAPFRLPYCLFHPQMMISRTAQEERDPKRPTQALIGFASHDATRDQSGCRYFGSIKWTPWIK